jgi:phage gp45-like
MRDHYLSRIELDDTKEIGDGLLYIQGRGRVGESRPDMLMAQHYGFASRPPAGSVGIKATLGARQSMPVILGIEHPQYRPKLQAGESALYDQYGNIIKLMSAEVVMDFQARTESFKAGGWTIESPVTIKGDLSVEGNISATGTITAPTISES